MRASDPSAATVETLFCLAFNSASYTDRISIVLDSGDISQPVPSGMETTIDTLVDSQHPTLSIDHAQIVGETASPKHAKPPKIDLTPIKDWGKSPFDRDIANINVIVILL
jgi:hypothetical protein